MKLLVKIFGSLICVSIFAVIILFWINTHPLPSIIIGVTARGFEGACPPATEQEAKIRDKVQALLKEHNITRESSSPELDQRLLTAFPPGTQEKLLIYELTKQKFGTPVACKADSSIKSMFFHQMDSIYQPGIRAQIYWKVDEKNQIIWTKGYVFNEGL